MTIVTDKSITKKEFITVDFFITAQKNGKAEISFLKIRIWKEK